MAPKPLSADEAFDSAPAAYPGSRYTELARPEIQPWLKEALKRVQEGRLTWPQAKVAINRLLEARGLPALTRTATAIGDYARRHYGGG